MSIRAQPAAIGAFLIGALAIAVGGVAVLASSRWFETRSVFISFFAESVNGLEVGAPVKFQGVPVGSVTELMIQIDRIDKTFQVPVRYDIDLSKLRTLRGTFVDLDDSTVHAKSPTMPGVATSFARRSFGSSILPRPFVTFLISGSPPFARYSPVYGSSVCRSPVALSFL